MTPDEFAAYLNDLGEELTDLQGTLSQVGSEIVTAMKVRVPVDTGRLKNSISYVVQDNTLSFQMMYYGPFQNYGVMGLAGPRVNPVPQFGVAQPSRPPFYAFQSREFGLSPQPFFDLEDIQAQVADALINIVER